MLLNSRIDSCKVWWKSWFSTPETFLLGAFAFMTLLGMSFPHSKPSHDSFWVLFLPSVLWAVLIRRKWTYFVHNKALWLGFGLLLLCMVSVLWSLPTTVDHQIDTIKDCFYTIVFVAGLFVALQSPVQQKIRFAKLLICLVLLGVIVSTTQFYWERPLSARLYGLSSLLGNPVLADPTLMACLITSALLLKQGGEKQHGYWLLVGFIFVAVYIFLSQTRAAIISFVVLFAIWGASYIGWKRSFLIIAVAFVGYGCLVLMTPSLQYRWEHHLSNGLSARLVIWNHDYLAFLERPFLGYGGASIFSESGAGKKIALALNSYIPHPHGLFFSNMYYYGLAGLIVWFSYIAAIALGLWKRKDRLAWLGLLSLGCLLLMTSADVHSLIAMAREPWWIWWLPTVTMISLIKSKSTDSNSSYRSDECQNLVETEKNG